MATPFRSQGGIVMSLHGPMELPTIDVPYPPGIEVGDLLIVSSHQSIIDSSIGSAVDGSEHWHPMGLPGGYRYSSGGAVAHLAHWAIADASDVAAGTLAIETSGPVFEYVGDYTEGHMQAWKRRTTMDDAFVIARIKGSGIAPPFPAWSGITGDYSVMAALGGTNYAPEGSPYTAPTLTWDTYTEAFQVSDSILVDQTSTLGGPAAYNWIATTYGGAYYPISGGIVPSTNPTSVSPDDPAGGDGFWWQFLDIGNTDTPYGYWGLLATPTT